MFRVNSIDDLPQSIQDAHPELVKELTKRRRNKYGVASVEDRTYNGRLYASKKEANFAQKLDLLVKAGDIKGYIEQVPFRLPGNTTHRIDFGVLEIDNTVSWMEVKGRDLPLGKLKRHQVEELYKIHIHVV